MREAREKVGITGKQKLGSLETDEPPPPGKKTVRILEDKDKKEGVGDKMSRKLVSWREGEDPGLMDTDMNDSDQDDTIFEEAIPPVGGITSPEYTGLSVQLHVTTI
jgi:hypothetical protein